MKLYLNRTQLARRLQIAPQTLRNKIKAGKIKPDAQDEYGLDLFAMAKFPIDPKTGKGICK